MVVAVTAKYLVHATPANERVITRSPDQAIIPIAAKQGVIAWSAIEHIVTRSPGESVISLAPEEIRRRHAPVAIIHEQHVVPLQAEDPDEGGVVGDGDA